MQSGRDIEQLSSSMHDTLQVDNWIQACGATREDEDMVKDVHLVIEYNWKEIRRLHEVAAEKLLKRIDHKLEEIKSLRDGVSYKTSSNEGILMDNVIW